MYVAVEGCGHGELDAIYDAVKQIETTKSIKISLLIICGDFQAVRNEDDLQCMAVPQKYYAIGTFYKYYSGQLVAPVLTLVIGGNHEASNYMQQLAYGGWLAPRIYYAGYASVLRFGGLRIAAQSGIYKQQDYHRGHYERPPYNAGSMRSAYHVRELETFRLKQLTRDIDVFISHDWPRGVYHHGNLQQLLRKKPFFKDEVASDQLGSPAGQQLLSCLQPSYWLAAHLHVKFAALVQHSSDSPDRSLSDTSSVQSTPGKRFTRFLALDKCLPKKRYLQVLEFPDTTTKSPISESPSTDEMLSTTSNRSVSDQPASAEPRLSYDLEWLTVLRLTDHLLSVSPSSVYLPGRAGSTNSERYDFRPTSEELAATRALWYSSDETQYLAVPENFVPTVSAYNGRADIRSGVQQAASTDPQTTQFCARLGIRDPMALLLSSTTPSTPIGSNSFTTTPGSCSSRIRRLQLPSPTNTTSCSANMSSCSMSAWSEPPSPASSALLTSLNSTTDMSRCAGDDDNNNHDHDDMFVIDRRGSLTGSVMSSPVVSQALSFMGSPVLSQAGSLMGSPVVVSHGGSLMGSPVLSHTGSLMNSPLAGDHVTSTPVAPSRSASCLAAAAGGISSSPRTRLQLPAPSKSTEHLPDNYTALGSLGDTESCQSAKPAGEAVMAEVPNKKFKRRNHALYTSIDDQ